MPKSWAAWGLALTVLGSGMAISGSLIMAHAYHALSFFKFLVHLFRIPFIFLFRGPSKTFKLMKAEVKAGALNQEDRAYSLLGLYFVFLGFCLQLLRSVCAYVGSP